MSKIGVSQVAMLAQEARVNFIVAAETYKVDFRTLTGKLIDVEQRDPTEIAAKEWMERNNAAMLAGVLVLIGGLVLYHGVTALL